MNRASLLKFFVTELRVWVGLICGFLSVTLQAQNEYVHCLQKSGFENVTAYASHDTLTAAIENTNYRGNYRGIGQAIKSLSACNAQINVFRILVLEYQKPQVVVLATRHSGLWSVQVDYDTQPLEQQILANASASTAREAMSTSTTRKIDVVLHPIFSFDNHKLDKLAEVCLFLAPSVETTLWRGNRIYLQPVIPIAHNLTKRNPDRRVQLGVLAIRQEWLNQKRWYLSTTLGSFLYNRYGVNAELAYHYNRQLDFGVRLGLTGEQLLLPNKWQTTAPNKFHGMANVNFYHPATSLQAKLSAGSFVYGDLGVRADLVRHFGEFTVGVYGIYTDGEKNAGFNFALPLSTRRQLRRGRVRIRFPQYFTWEYSMLNYYRYAFEHMGQDYKERPDKSFTTHYWQAAYLQQYITRFLNGVIR